MIKIKSYRLNLFTFIALGLALLTTACYYAIVNMTPPAATATSGAYSTVSSESSTNSTPKIETNPTTGFTSDAYSKNSGSNLTSQYEFPEIGLKIKYPPNWEKTEYGRAVKAYGEGLIANFLSPLEGPLDKFREFVQLRIENSTSDNLVAMTADNNYIGNNPIYQTVFDRLNLANKSDSLTTLKAWSPLNDKALVIEFSAVKSEFAKFLPLALEVINSVQINGIGVSSSAGSTNQSNQLQSYESSSEEKPAIANGNNTHTSSVIEKLLE